MIRNWEVINYLKFLVCFFLSFSFMIFIDNFYFSYMKLVQSKDGQKII